MKEINIKIDREDFQTIKGNGYKLCIAGRTSEYCRDIVAMATDDYFENNIVIWDNKYRIFFSRTIENRQPLRRSVTSVGIETGQYVTVDANGSMSDPASGERKDQMEIRNDFGVLYPGLERKMIYGDQKFFAPVFIAPQASIKGTYTMKPTDCFTIWFEQNIESETLILEQALHLKSAGRSTSIEADLSECDVVTVFYKSGNWKK